MENGQLPSLNYKSRKNSALGFQLNASISVWVPKDRDFPLLILEQWDLSCVSQGSNMSMMQFSIYWPSGTNPVLLSSIGQDLRPGTASLSNWSCCKRKLPGTPQGCQLDLMPPASESSGFSFWNLTLPWILTSPHHKHAVDKHRNLIRLGLHYLSTGISKHSPSSYLILPTSYKFSSGPFSRQR